MTHRWGYPIVQLDDTEAEVEATLEPTTEAKIDQILTNTVITIADAAAAKTAAEEVDEHLHNYERWLGKLAVPAGGKVAEEATLTPFRATSGNNTWGTAIQVLDVNDTPVIPGMVTFDAHRLIVVDTSATTVYRIRMAFGATYAAAITAGTYSGFIIRAQAATLYIPIEVRVKDHPVGTKVWVNIWNATNGATVDFFVGIHEYAN